MQLPQILTSPAGGLWCYCDLSRSPSAQISAGGSLQNIQNIQNFQNMKKIWSSILLEWGIPNKKRLISDTELDLFWEEPHNSFSLPCGDGKSDVGLRSWQEIAVNVVTWSALIGNISVWQHRFLTLLVFGRIGFGHIGNAKPNARLKDKDWIVWWLLATVDARNLRHISTLEKRLKLDCRQNLWLRWRQNSDD